MDQQHKDLKLEDFLIVLCASQDGTWEFDTSNAINDVIRKLDRFKVAACSDKAGISVARTHLLEKTAKAVQSMGIEIPNNTIRALWVDSDIRIADSVDRIAYWISEADKHGWNIIGNYHGIWQNMTYINTLCKPPNENGAYTFYADHELADLPPFYELERGCVGGLGFYYGDVPIDYKFRFEAYGEDILFFRDMYHRNPEWRLRYVPVQLRHLKRLPI